MNLYGRAPGGAISVADGIMQHNSDKIMQQNNSEVDVNVLISLYNNKLATALNQNILLEAKLETLRQDSDKEIQLLQEELEKLKKAKKPV